MNFIFAGKISANYDWSEFCLPPRVQRTFSRGYCHYAVYLAGYCLYRVINYGTDKQQISGEWPILENFAGIQVYLFKFCVTEVPIVDRPNFNHFLQIYVTGRNPGEFKSLQTGRTILWNKPMSGLSKGASGVVYRFGDTAIKAFCWQTPDSEFSILTEYSLLSKLNHPNIISCLDLIDFGNGLTVGLVMPLAEKNLWEAIRSGLTLETKFSYIRQILSGLAYLKSANVLHRDIKPENYVVFGNVIKLIDFGLAKDLTCTIPEKLVNFYYTRLYRAPEVFLGEPCSWATEMWAAGCVIYEILTGRIAFYFSSDEAYEVKVIAQFFSEIPSCLKKLKKWDDSYQVCGNNNLYEGLTNETTIFLSQFLQLDPDKRCKIEEVDCRLLNNDFPIYQFTQKDFPENGKKRITIDIEDMDLLLSSKLPPQAIELAYRLFTSLPESSEIPGTRHMIAAIILSSESNLVQENYVSIENYKTRLVNYERAIIVSTIKEVLVSVGRYLGCLTTYHYVKSEECWPVIFMLYYAPLIARLPVKRLAEIADLIISGEDFPEREKIAFQLSSMVWKTREQKKIFARIRPKEAAANKNELDCASIIP